MFIAAHAKSVGAKFLLFPVTTGILLGLCTDASAQSRRAAARDAAIAKLQSDIPDLLSQGNVPGMSIAVIRGGKIFWHNNFGVKNLKSAEPVDDSTVVEAASLSKPVFAYAVLKLVER